jgi:hypothetical protein
VQAFGGSGGSGEPAAVCLDNRVDNSQTEAEPVGGRVVGAFPPAEGPQQVAGPVGGEGRAGVLNGAAGVGPLALSAARPQLPLCAGRAIMPLCAPNARYAAVRGAARPLGER